MNILQVQKRIHSIGRNQGVGYVFYSVNQLPDNSFFNAQKCHYEYYPDNCILLLSFLFPVHVCASIEGNSHQIPPPSTSSTSCIMFSFQQIIRASIYISTMYFLFKLDIFVSVLSGNKTTAAFYQIYYKNYDFT